MFTPTKLQVDVMVSAFASITSRVLTDKNIEIMIGPWLQKNTPALKEIVAIANDTLTSGESYDELALALISRLRQTSGNVRSLIASCCLNELIGPNAMRHQDLKKRLERVRDELTQGL